jgi:hypothetical protein
MTNIYQYWQSKAMGRLGFLKQYFAPESAMRGLHKAGLARSGFQWVERVAAESREVAKQGLG